MDTEATVAEDRDIGPQFEATPIAGSDPTPQSDTPAPTDDGSNAGSSYDPQEIARLREQRAASSAEAKRLAMELKQEREEKERYRTALGLPDKPKVDRSQIDQVSPYVTPLIDERFTPLEQQVQQQGIMAARVYDKLAFRDLLDENPDAEPYKDTIKAIAQTSSASYDQIWDTLKPIVEKSMEANRDVVNVKRSVRIEPPRVSNKTPQKAKDISSYSDDEMEAAMRDKNSTVSQMLLEEARMRQSGAYGS